MPKGRGYPGDAGYRITMDDLQRKLYYIKAHKGARDFSISGAYGKVKVSVADGSRDISPLMSKAELYSFLTALEGGLLYKKRSPKLTEVHYDEFKKAKLPDDYYKKMQSKGRYDYDKVWLDKYKAAKTKLGKTSRRGM